MVTPMAEYAREVTESGDLQRICNLLRERDVRLADVTGDVAAVATVHQVKGFEYDHCAVHSDLLSPETPEECNVSFVAFTRHRRSLVVMCARATTTAERKAAA